jgi:hypothetical protein
MDMDLVAARPLPLIPWTVQLAQTGAAHGI